MSQAGAETLAALFADLGIVPDLVEHPPVHTVEEALEPWGRLAGRHAKNLFLKDNKGGAHHLVTLAAETRIDMKALAPLIDAKRLSFASADALMEVLGTSPGAVGPLSLVNDPAHRVSFAIERGLIEAERVLFHPLRNTATVSITTADLRRLLDRLGVAIRVIDLPPATA